MDLQDTALMYMITIAKVLFSKRIKNLQRCSTYKTVSVQGAFTSSRTFDVTAVPGACSKTAAITLRSAHRLSHWETQENRVEQRSAMCMSGYCVIVFASPSLCWERRSGRRRREWRNSEPEQLGTHRSDTGSCLAPSSNLHRICDMGLRGWGGCWAERHRQTTSTYKTKTIQG